MHTETCTHAYTRQWKHCTIEIFVTQQCFTVINKAKRDETKEDMARHGKTWQDKTWQNHRINYTDEQMTRTTNFMQIRFTMNLIFREILWLAANYSVQHLKKESVQKLGGKMVKLRWQWTINNCHLDFLFIFFLFWMKCVSNHSRLYEWIPCTKRILWWWR